MATIHCRCGKSFSDGSIPSEHEFHLLPDVAMEDVLRNVIRLAREAEDTEVEVGLAITNETTTVYKCPYCEELIVFWDGLMQEPRFYKLE